MSEYKCQEPDCNFHIGIAGDLATDLDFEQQDYYDQEVEEHYQMHEEQKDEKAQRMVDVEQSLEVVGRDLGVSHLGMQINVLGSWWTLIGVSTEYFQRVPGLKVTVGKPGPVPEMLFADVGPDSVLQLRSAPLTDDAAAPDERVVKVLRCEVCGYALKLYQQGEAKRIGVREGDSLSYVMNLHRVGHGLDLDRKNISAIRFATEQILSRSSLSPSRGRKFWSR